jgi:uncharacterized protein (TIGR00297 family)
LQHLFFILFIVFAITGAVLAKKLTLVAAVTGGVLASVIYMGLGWIGVIIMAAFFLLGTLATSWKKSDKQSLHLAEESRGRNTGQVVANGGVGALLGALAIAFPQHSSIFLFLLAAAFSSATADTVSSELGSVYGSRFYDILTFRNGQRGKDGVVSREGTLAGIVGSCIIAAAYAMSEEWDKHVVWIIVSGTIGNLADSYLGATLERKGIIRNDAVNFLNTAIAVLAAYLFHSI